MVPITIVFMGFINHRSITFGGPTLYLVGWLTYYKYIVNNGYYMVIIWLMMVNNNMDTIPAIPFCHHDDIPW